MTAMLGLVTFVYMAVMSGELPYVSYYYLAGFSVLVVVLLVWLKRWTEREAERAQDWLNLIMDRLTGRRR
jgi:membrane protein implicated in regulation of membrane protease activity